MREEFDTNTPYMPSPVPESVRRRAAQIKEKYESEEFQAFLLVAKSAILDGDGAGIRAWAEGRTGHKPDSILRVHLGGKGIKNATPRETWRIVDGRGEKLAGAAEEKANARRAAAFNARSRKYQRLRDSLATHSNKIREIERATWVLSREEGQPPTMGEIEQCIIRDSKALFPHRLVVTSLDVQPEVKSNDPGLSLTEHRRWEDRLLSLFLLENPALRDRLTPRQQEILSLLRAHYTPKEIAAVCGVKRATVDVHLKNLREMVRRAISA